MTLIARIYWQFRAMTHRLLGHVCLWMGQPLAAKSHFERVLALRGSDFSARMHLGRLAYLTGDYDNWRRHLTAARLADASQFAKWTKLTHPHEMAQGPQLAGTGIDAREFAPHRPPRAIKPVTEKSAKEDRTPNDACAEAVAGMHDLLDSLLHAGNSQPADDLRSPAERARFAKLSPITRTQVQNCDVDALAQRLAGGKQTG